MTRNLNVTPKTVLCSIKSTASVTIIRLRTIHYFVEATTDGHKASRGLSATAELLVFSVLFRRQQLVLKYVTMFVCNTYQKSFLISGLSVIGLTTGYFL